MEVLDSEALLVNLVDLDAGPRVTGRLSPDAAEPSLGDRLILQQAEGQDLVFAPAA